MYKKTFEYVSSHTNEQLADIVASYARRQKVPCRKGIVREALTALQVRNDWNTVDEVHVILVKRSSEARSAAAARRRRAKEIEKARRRQYALEL